jgi:hypothetical protein
LCIRDAEGHATSTTMPSESQRHSVIVQRCGGKVGMVLYILDPGVLYGQKELKRRAVYGHLYGTIHTDSGLTYGYVP